MNKLLALADRVEKLTGPNREVDCLIYAAVFIPADRAGKIDIGVPYVGWHPVDGPYVSAVEAPRYTASLDAAMTLVPEGCFPHFGKAKGMPAHRTWYADCAPPNRNDWLEDEWFCETEAATPALALASSALRARAHGGGEG